MSRSRYWCFTTNNYTADHVLHLSSLYPASVSYLVYGREVGEQGTPHLQGYVIFPDRKRLSTARNFIPGSHLVAARGSPKQASDYAKKGNDFDEFGECPEGPAQGKRSDIDRFVEWVASLDSRPSDRELAREFPSLWLRYPDRLHALCVHLRDPIAIGAGEPRAGWQRELVDYCQSEPDDRSIRFMVDPEGNTGKSWMSRYLMTNREDVQVLRIGKRDDLAHMIDETKRVFIFDVPRKQMEFLQYSILESLKDRFVSSPKYNSTMKILEHVPHVIVFCNEPPDLNALSLDRINIINLN